MDVRRRSGRKGRQRLRRIWAVLAAIAVAMPTVAALATPVAAQAQYLEVRKTAQPYELEPGQTFTYSIQVQCSEQSVPDRAPCAAGPDAAGVRDRWEPAADRSVRRRSRRGRGVAPPARRR